MKKSHYDLQGQVKSLMLDIGKVVKDEALVSCPLTGNSRSDARTVYITYDVITNWFPISGSMLGELFGKKQFQTTGASVQLSVLEQKVAEQIGLATKDKVHALISGFSFKSKIEEMKSFIEETNESDATVSDIY